MLKIRTDKEAVWCKFKYRGTYIELQIRPSDPDRLAKIHEKHTEWEIVEDPKTKTPARIPHSNDSAIVRDSADYLIGDFRGVGNSEGQPLEVNTENKYLIYMLPPSNGEKPLNEQINSKANDIKTFIDEEEDQDIKN